MVVVGILLLRLVVQEAPGEVPGGGSWITLCP